MPEEMITFKQEPEKAKSEGKNHRAIKFASRSLESFKRAVERKNKRTKLETNYNEMYDKVQKMIKKDDKGLEEEISYGLDYLKRIGVKLIAMDFDKRVKLESESKKVKLKGSTLSRIYQRAKKFIDNKVLREATKTVARENFDDAFYNLRFGNEQEKNNEASRLGDYSNFVSSLNKQHETSPISVEPVRKDADIAATTLDAGLSLNSLKNPSVAVDEVKPVEVDSNVGSILSGFASTNTPVETTNNFNADDVKPVEIDPNAGSILSGFAPKSFAEKPVVAPEVEGTNAKSIITRYNDEVKAQGSAEKEVLLENYLSGVQKAMETRDSLTKGNEGAQLPTVDVSLEDKNEGLTSENEASVVEPIIVDKKDTITRENTSVSNDEINESTPEFSEVRSDNLHNKEGLISENEASVVEPIIVDKKDTITRENTSVSNDEINESTPEFSEVRSDNLHNKEGLISENEASVAEPIIVDKKDTIIRENTPVSDDKINEQISRLSEVRRNNPHVNSEGEFISHRMHKYGQEKPVVKPTIKLRPVAIDESVQDVLARIVDSDNMSLSQLKAERAKLDAAYNAAIVKKEEEIKRAQEEREEKERRRAAILEELSALDAELDGPRRR